MKDNRTATKQIGLGDIHLLNVATELAELNKAWAECARKQREKEERNNCIRCGKPITDWEEVEQTDTELIMTYKCSCGCYADQHFKLIYDRTEEIE